MDDPAAERAKVLVPTPAEAAIIAAFPTKTPADRPVVGWVQLHCFGNGPDVESALRAAGDHLARGTGTAIAVDGSVPVWVVHQRPDDVCVKVHAMIPNPFPGRDKPIAVPGHVVRRLIEHARHGATVAELVAALAEALGDSPAEISELYEALDGVDANGSRMTDGPPGCTRVSGLWDLPEGWPRVMSRGRDSNDVGREEGRPAASAEEARDDAVSGGAVPSPRS